MRFALVVAGLMGCATGEVPLAPEQVVTDGGAYAVALEPGPTPWATGTEVALHLEVAHDGAPVTDSAVALTPWMPDMGHGLTDPVEVVADGTGGHDARWVFTMPGYWELTLEVDGAHGPDTAVVAYEVP